MSRTKMKKKQLCRYYVVFNKEEKKLKFPSQSDEPPFLFMNSVQSASLAQSVILNQKGAKYVISAYLNHKLLRFWTNFDDFVYSAGASCDLKTHRNWSKYPES